MENLIMTIVQPLVDSPDDVRVEIEEQDSKIIYTLHVNQNDMGKIIGKQGRVIKAVRSLVYAASSRAPKRVYLELFE